MGKVTGNQKKLPKLWLRAHARPKPKTTRQKMPKTRNRSKNRFCNFDGKYDELSLKLWFRAHASQQNPSPKNSFFFFSKAAFSSAGPIHAFHTKTEVSRTKNTEIWGIIRGKIKRRGPLPPPLPPPPPPPPPPTLNLPLPIPLSLPLPLQLLLCRH